MKYAMTGATGFVGQALADICTRRATRWSQWFGRPTGPASWPNGASSLRRVICPMWPP